MTEELRKKHLQQLDDGNGTWQALKEVLDEAIDLSIGSALTDGIDNEDRNWRAGYAQAMKDTMATLNRYRKIWCSRIDC